MKGKIVHVVREDGQTATSKLISKFLSRTRIKWLSYLVTRKTLLSKVTWLSVIVTCVSMALYQSRTAMNDYFGYAVSLQTTFEISPMLPFPAVTICSNTPFNWTYEESANSSLYQEINTRMVNSTERDIYDKRYKNKGKPFEEFVLYDSLRKSRFNESGFGVIDIIYWNGTRYTKSGVRSANFTELESKGYLRRFRDFYYGECVTFNSAIDPEDSIKSSALTGPTFTLKWDPKERWIYHSDPTVIAIIHSPGTAPVLGDGSNIKIYPKDEVTIGVKERVIQRLEDPYPSQCVHSDSMKLRTNSVYYDVDRRYYYTMEACINTCIQRLSLTYCGCWDYQLPVGILRRRSRLDAVCPARCSKIDTIIDMDLCECRLPCRETVMDYVITVEPNFLEGLVSNDLNPELNETAKKTVLRVFLKSTMFEKADEIPKFTVAEFWGIMGGNAAFWVGVSAISLFELVELLYYILRNVFQAIPSVLKSRNLPQSVSKLHSKSSNKTRLAISKKEPPNKRKKMAAWSQSAQDKGFNFRIRHQLV